MLSHRQSIILPIVSISSLAMHVATALAQSPPQIEIIARSGTTAPGGLAGQTFVAFNPPMINNRGDVAFSALLTGEFSDNSGVWLARRSQPPVLIVREGAAAGPTTRFTEFYSTGQAMALSHGGHVTFVSNLAGPGSRDSGASAWSTRTGTREQLGRVNQTATLGVSTVTLTNFTLPMSTPGGYTLYTANSGGLLVQDAGNGAPSRTGIASLDRLTPNIPYQVGTMQLASMSSSGLALVQSAGTASSTPSFSPSLIRYNAQGFPIIISDGTTDTTLFPGSFARSFSESIIADDGTIAFRAIPRASSPNSNPPSSLFYIRNGQRREILTQRGALPILRATETVTDWTNLDMSASGQLLISLTALDQLTGMSRQVIALYNGTSWVSIAAQGEPAPGFTNRFFGSTFSAAMSSNGIVLLRNRLVDDLGALIGEATWITRASRGLSLLFTDRVLIDVDTGPAEDFRLMRPSWRTAVRTVNIEGSSVNADGSIGVAFTDVNDSQFMIVARVTPPDVCDSIDFNRNGVFPENQDVIDFFSALAGDCPVSQGCDIDFNNNSVFPEDQDVIDFFNVIAGGSCL